MIQLVGVSGLFYILYGKDDFRCREALEEIKKGLGDPEMLAVNTSSLHSEQLNLSQLRDVCSAVPFLCPARLVIVQGLLARFEPKPGVQRRATRSPAGSNSELQEWQALGDYIEQMAPTTVLVLLDGEITGNNRLLRSLSPLANVKAFPQLRDNELDNWIRKRVSQGGGTISREAVSLLAQLIGGDLWTMSTEIDKLLAYGLGGVTEDSVRQLTSYAREANVFALVDAILEGRPKVAQQLLHQMLQEGAAPSYLLVMITRQLRLIVRARELNQGLSRSEMRKRLGVTSDYSLDKALKQAKTYTLERVKSAYHGLLEADIAIKTGKYDGDLALGLLVIELCRP
ncbi:MAG: DNA polymerase III subunit delta [Dehalococcoidia bacterium]|nr:DNA polymerase III subunit delta [Dehalococcoidia bacterium]